ncbi:MAG TPA: DNA cytosine methyltransferase [Jiangellales bacterium]|nr:DNA cytosine methyltransferase [Jiangellales bacterium]
MNVLSLFAGIGGLDLGLERAGMTVVGQVEIDPFCQRVLAKHWPEVPRHDDVRTAVAWWLGRTRPALDVVAGGFPCQPVSVAGKRRAQDDERWLWPAAWAVIRDLRPRYAILENVPGLLARGMGDVLGDLAAIGYDAEWDCVPAAAVGAPHRRDRVFIVAYPDGESVRVRAGEATGAAGGDEGPPPERQRVRADAGSSGDVLADAQGERRRARRPGLGHAHGPPPYTFAAQSPPRSTVGQRGWWATEPNVGRVAHGVPGRVDRLRALGNAVVPQVAEHIGRLVMAANHA